MRIFKALTIAGLDPSGGAGIIADIRTFNTLRVYGIGVVTAITLQNTKGVNNISTVPTDVVSSQLKTLFSDIVPDAIKTGMLYEAEIIEVVSEVLREFGVKNIVIDPVMVSSTGVKLLKEDAVDVLKARLLPLALVVTPNLHEASILSTIEVEDIGTMKKAAEIIKDMGPTFVIIKGGHLHGKPVDLIYDGMSFGMFGGERVEDKKLHGVGCVFSAAITAYLARGHTLRDAAGRAKEFIIEGIKGSVQIGSGMDIIV